MVAAFRGCCVLLIQNRPGTETRNDVVNVMCFLAHLLVAAATQLPSGHEGLTTPARMLRRLREEGLPDAVVWADDCLGNGGYGPSPPPGERALAQVEVEWTLVSILQIIVVTQAVTYCY